MISTATPSLGSLDDGFTLRPTKRARMSSESIEHRPPLAQQLVLEEIDLEISIRRRLADTINSRITWALLLQESVQRSMSDTARTEDDFEEAAYETLTALEEPCSGIFTRSPLHPKRTHFPLHQSVSSTFSVETVPQPTSIITSRRHNTRVRGLPRLALPPKKLLFLRNSTTSPTEIAKLACPGCSRSDFSNLQGLLNHCRLRHQREYNSHDECVQSCAVLVPEEERSWVVENGTELSGISLPSLRRLFEIAVGGNTGIGPVIMAKRIDPEKEGEIARTNVENLVNTQTDSTHLTRTLGFHKDTPALAPFLGLAPKQRCINVYDDDHIVDIFGGDSGPIGLHIDPAKPAWHMPYTHRNLARPELDEIVDIPSLSSHDEPGSTSADNVPTNPAPTTGSRFHITARVSITDHSLWIPPHSRMKEKQDHTHRWRLSIASPSYSLHLSTFLAKLKVTCITDPPLPTFLEPITLTEPPFVITRTTDRPFLVRITFTWVGTHNSTMDVDHWIDLDPMRGASPVLGDEQFFDVELDRRTALLPLRADTTVPWEPFDDARLRTEDTGEHAVTDTNPAYVRRLKHLLPLAPMTSKDVKGRIPEQLPYKLVSPAQLHKLVVGRRKAIEVLYLLSHEKVLAHNHLQHARARTLQKAYQRSLERYTDTDHLPLTTADVYRWMEDEGLFPRSSDAHPTVLQKRKRKTDSVSEELPREVYCRGCGLHYNFHPSLIKTETSDASDAAVISLEPSSAVMCVDQRPTICLKFKNEGTQSPTLDIRRLLSMPWLSRELPLPLPYTLAPRVMMPPSLSGSALSQYALEPRNLVAVGDPRLMQAIGKLAREWKLKYFSPPLPVGFEAKAALEARLAPYALLAVVTKLVAHLLVRSGLGAMRREDAAVFDKRTRRTPGNVAVRRLMTPTHIFDGLTRDASEDTSAAAALMCVSESQVSLETWTQSGLVQNNFGLLGSITPVNAQIKTEEL